MMNTKFPPEFTPYKELIVCSNKFIDGQVPIEVNNYNILLVGKGEHPLVWISTFTSPKSKLLIHLVDKNQSIQQGFEVILPKNETIITFNKIILLHVRQNSEENAEIIEIDFRPIGLVIHGDNNGLFVGTNQLVNNIFSNSHTMIAIGE